jgi:uncharacterized protein
MNLGRSKLYGLLGTLLLAGCLGLIASGQSAKPNGAQAGSETMAASNPVFHFEIAVSNLDRAVRFYEGVLNVKLTRRSVDGYEMAFFPRADGRPGASGALAMGDAYVPSKTGPIIYFDVPDIDQALDRAKALGAVVLYPKKDIGADGYVAEIEDSEGNRMALSAIKN